MSSFVLKIMAVLSMCFDHFGYWLTAGNFSFCNYLGRLAFPIFAFQISEGYEHTNNLGKYFWRLFLFAVISQLPFNLFEYTFGFDLTLNIFFTLLLGLSAICAYDKIPNKFAGLLVAGVCVYLGHLLNVDYGYWGVLVVFAFYLMKNNKFIMCFGFLGLVLLKYLPLLIQNNFYYAYIYLAIFTFISIIPMLLYNGKQGLKTKYLLYIFYPFHLAVIAFANLI